tara:strand:+ start:162 stop:491 length:330 start_codon:yes stop_codon:yes gene_type:complete
MKETEKYGSKLYKPNKPYHKMSMQELSDHCKICKSLDKMSYNKIRKIENLSFDVLQKKIKHFLERNIGKKTKKTHLKKLNRTKNKKENMNKKSKKQPLKKLNKTKKTNI